MRHARPRSPRAADAAAVRRRLIAYCDDAQLTRTRVTAYCAARDLPCPRLELATLRTATRTIDVGALTRRMTRNLERSRDGAVLPLLDTACEPPRSALERFLPRPMVPLQRRADLLYWRRLRDYLVWCLAVAA